MAHIDIADVKVPSNHYVDGGWIGSQTTFLVRSPLDWSTPLGEISLGTIDTGFTAIEAARRASLAWAAMGASGRAAHLHRLADAILELTDEIATVEAVGDSLVTSTEINRLTLMGSMISARNNAVMAARNLHQYRLELPAKATFIVLDDADLDEAARAAAAHFSIADPASLAGVRVLASRQIGRPLLEALTEEMRSLESGDSRHVETTAPPMIHQQPHTRLHALVDRCRAAGDEVVSGGGPIEGQGLHFEPTLIRPRSLHSEAVTEEVLGPVVTFEVFDNDHGAIAMSNATTAPVIASVYTAIAERATPIAGELDAEIVRLNHAPVSESLVPIEGSASAREMLDFHSRPKTIGLPRIPIDGHVIVSGAAETAEV